MRKMVIRSLCRGLFGSVVFCSMIGILPLSSVSGADDSHLGERLAVSPMHSTPMSRCSAMVATTDAMLSATGREWGVNTYCEGFSGSCPY